MGSQQLFPCDLGHLGSRGKGQESSHNIPNVQDSNDIFLCSPATLVENWLSGQRGEHKSSPKVWKTRLWEKQVQFFF